MVLRWRPEYGGTQTGRMDPIDIVALADFAHEAGLPPGVFNVVQGYGEVVGDALVKNPDVARISLPDRLKRPELSEPCG